MRKALKLSDVRGAEARAASKAVQREDKGTPVIVHGADSPGGKTSGRV